MNKSQALNKFWNSFGLPAYDENSVPEYVYDKNGNRVKLEPPYITYSDVTDSLDREVALTASIWNRSTSWAFISEKADEIARVLGKYGHLSLPIDGGYLYMYKGSPFTNKMSDEDKTIKRIILNVTAEFLTAY